LDWAVWFGRRFGGVDCAKLASRLVRAIGRPQRAPNALPKRREMGTQTADWSAAGRRFGRPSLRADWAHWAAFDGVAEVGKFNQQIWPGPPFARPVLLLGARCAMWPAS